MNKRRLRMMAVMLISATIATSTFANVSGYVTEDEYNDILNDRYIEDRGIVVENQPDLGYIVYRNESGREITCYYYKEEIVVEKTPYYESEDRIGYLDELFPSFEYDPRDISITSIMPGDNIYIRRNHEGVATYISAYNDYLMRYAKVISYDYNTGGLPSIGLQDDKGNVYYYEIPLQTPITKGGKLISFGGIQTGDWVKVLVSQRIMGIGHMSEKVIEIVVDNGSRYIENLYRGKLLNIDSFNQAMNLADAQVLGKSAWGPYNSLKRLGINMSSTLAYVGGNRMPMSYIDRYMRNYDGYAYVATENYKGKESAVKLNFQSKSQVTLPPSLVISATGNTIKLLSGHTINVAEDSIIVRDKRLIDGNGIMVGDTITAVITGESKLAVGTIQNKEQTNSLEVYRGRINKIEDRESFEVETFSLLNGTTWYYHPTPHVFTIDAETRFYTSEGFVENGIESFIDYGEQTLFNKVFTVVADGGRAKVITDIGYSTEAVKGEVYKTEEGKVSIKDVYYYHNDQKKWVEYSRKNVGATLNVQPNTVIIKDGEAVPMRMLEVGDKLSVVVEENIKDTDGVVTSYVIRVDN